MKSALAALCLAGCATVFAGGPDEIPVNTNPPGAYVYVNGQMIGQTPTVIRMHALGRLVAPRAGNRPCRRPSPHEQHRLLLNHLIDQQRRQLRQ